jgi:hypothetical protein
VIWIFGFGFGFGFPPKSPLGFHSFIMDDDLMAHQFNHAEQHSFIHSFIHHSIKEAKKKKKKAPKRSLFATTKLITYKKK